MCFSPEASFAGGILISAIGVATLSKVHNPSLLVFASIPLFFGIQQITEGFLWLAIQNPEFSAIQNFSTYLFLIMAEVLWPVMIPLSVLYMEKNKDKKRILKILLVMGAILSSYYAFCLLVYQVHPQIMGYHIQYSNDFPKTIGLFAFAVYLIVTITPLFVSSIPRTHLLGIFMFLSCLITGIFFTQYLTSVWCFFAAFISVVIYWILKNSKQEFDLNQFNLFKGVHSR